MPRFNFKLERILEYRTQLEEQSRMLLAKAQAEYDAQQSKLNDLEQKLAAHNAKQVESSEDANKMWLWRQYKDALIGDIYVAQSELRNLALKLQKCRQDAIERSKDKKLLEKLKENQAKKYHEEAAYEEQKENDEMATVRYEREDF